MMESYNPVEFSLMAACIPKDDVGAVMDVFVLGFDQCAAAGWEDKQLFINVGVHWLGFILALWFRPPNLGRYFDLQSLRTAIVNCIVKWWRVRL